MLTLSDKIMLINFISYFVQVNGPVLIHKTIEASNGVKLLMLKTGEAAPAMPFLPAVSLSAMSGETLQQLAYYVRDVYRGKYKKFFRGRTFSALAR